MHRMKKILIYLSICAGFIFCFFNSNKINVLAISTDNNQNIGSIPLKLDIENYNTKNLFDGDLQYGAYVFADGNYTWVNDYRSNKNLINVIPSSSIVISFSGDINQFGSGFVFYNNGVFVSSSSNTFSAVVPSNANQVGFNLLLLSVNNDNLTNIQLEYGSSSTSYAPMFKFGYNVSGRIEMMCAPANAPGINFKGFINNNTLFDVTFSSGDSCYSFDINNVYVPFNIDNNGYVSFDSNIKFTLSSSAATLYSIQHGSYLRFTPIYYGFYKGNLINNILYSNLNYTSNNIYFNDFQYIYTGDSTGNSLVFNGNKNVWGYSQWIENNIKTNVISDFIESIKITNQFKFHEFLGFSFDVNLFSNYIDQPLDMFVKNNILVSFGSINSRVINNTSTTIPLPDNDLTTDKYNSCSAWYDIPCQLGNAITYVIYEAPIISPIINFFDSFVDLIGSLVTYITWFEGLGLIFGVFIVIFFIRMIILLVKGGNDD